MQNQIKSNDQTEFKKEVQFDLSQAFSSVAKNINQADQEQVELSRKLISELNINARQKLKQYKKILQSGQKENLKKEKEFINKHLKKVFLQQYLFGNTQNKPSLLTLLKKLQNVTYTNLIEASKGVKISQFQSIKTWSEIVDLIFREFQLQVSAQEFQGFREIVECFDPMVFEGCSMIERNEFKSKWLATFTQIVRTQNLLVRIFTKYIQPSTKDNLINACRSTISRASFLSKQVISQLFLLLVFLNPQQPQPSQQNHLCLIHYFHAQSVIKGVNNIKSLVSLIPKLKQTEHKCQLLLFLEQSFIQHYSKLNSEEQKTFRDNVFDQVINLFEVGRSIYGYLHTIVKIIIQAGDHWNMEGNFVRKFFISTIVLRLLPSKSIIQQWPTIVQDIIVQCGYMGVPYAIDCAKILFQKLYEENDKNFQKWSGFWIESYKTKLLSSNEKGSIRGVIEFINPILLKVCPNPFLLKQLLELSEKESNSNLELGVIALIRCYKEIGQIQVNENDQVFQHVLDKSISFSFDKIRNLLLSNDEMIALQALELVCCSLKPSEFVKPLQLKLCLEFYRHSLKTSMPEFRKNYLAVTKKLFDRLRNIYETLLVNKQADKKTSKKLYYTQFVDFLKQLVNICFLNVFSDAIFQLVNPALEILQLLQNYFGNKRNEVKKGIIFEATAVLQETSFYDFCNFQNLLSCLQSSYESVRQLAHDLLNLFNKIQKKELLLQLWQTSLKNTNKLAIRSFEYACRILTYISDTYPELLNIEKKYDLSELNVLNYFLILTKQRYAIFKDEFINQGSNYYNNLIHGLLTIFSYQLDKLAQQFSSPETYKQKYASASKEIKQFLNEFFIEVVNMLNFAVEISSSNVSTVILDTLTQGSQTDKKLKVDCRGHFLQENQKEGSNIGTFLESTALISSMEDDEEGIENTLVVSFYLLTRQAGLVFQSIGGLISNDNSSDYIPSQALIKLINTYFYALVNLRHMGSVDRISKGLGKMSRVIFDHESKQLNELPQTLLNKLLTHLKSGNFTNILRRSAGVPFAFCCLLKSASMKRGKLVETSVNELLSLSRQNKENPIELRIHALNILKKLFQDSDLKGDLDPYVSDAFISSIKGFTSEQWGVRNSSLMLFTALSNRTVGVRPTYNLLEFFIKCPNLLQFIQNELNSFNEASLNTMYPPLYPIVLLFSRLLPFDLKQKSKIIPNDNMKHIRKEELLSLLPILDRAGLNNNYMGRVMTAKAILPFMEIDEIYRFCVQGLEKLPHYFNVDNNLLHYQLTKYNHLLNSYNEICNNTMKNIEISGTILDKFWVFLKTQYKAITNLGCPVVLESFIKIFHYFFENFSAQMSKTFGEDYFLVVQNLCHELKRLAHQYVFQTERLVILGDLGHSMMRKEVISFELDLLIKYTNNFESFKNLAVQFNEFLSTKLQQNESFFQTSDNEICEFYLQRILENIKILKEDQKIQLFNSLTYMLEKLELSKIGSDIIISMVLELRITIRFISAKNEGEVKFLLNLQSHSNNHFLKIAIFKYLTYIKVSQDELLRLLLSFSDPNSLQELRQCAAEYLQTLPEYNQKLNIVCIRLLEDEQYEIRKYTARVLSLQLKIYHYNETVIKNQILAQLSVSDLTQLLNVNSDFKIKRKNHEEERIFSYDKPNKFRSDSTTLFQVLSANKRIHQSLEQLSEIFKQSLNESERNGNAVQTYKKDIIGRNQYQFQLVLRQLFSGIGSNKFSVQKLEEISAFHPLFVTLIGNIKPSVKY